MKGSSNAFIQHSSFRIHHLDCWVPRTHPERVDGLLAPDLVDVEAGERGRVEVQGDEVLAADVGVAELVDVWDVRAGDLAGRPLARGLVEEAARLVHLEERLPHHA